VTMHYTLTDDSGTTIDSSAGRDPLTYLHGYGNIIPDWKRRSKAAKPVSSRASMWPPAKATASVMPMPCSKRLRAVSGRYGCHPGTRVFADGPNGPIPFTIMEVTESNVKLDANHPLAGMNLHFEVEIVEVRAATDEEISTVTCTTVVTITSIDHCPCLPQRRTGVFQLVRV